MADLQALQAPRLALLLQRMAAAERAAPPGRALVLAIDGRAAAGKTTLAAALEKALGAGVIHMDDFFLPQALRTPARYAEPGGNVHYERFAAEVLPHLHSPAAFAYTRFDCATMRAGPPVPVPAARWRIVEGAYSTHPFFGRYWELAVFVDIAPAAQLARITARGGAECARAFAGRWIPLEERYIAACRPRERADLILEGSEPEPAE